MRRGNWLVLAFTLLSGCGADPPVGPTPGVLEVRLAGPATAGSALMLVEGGPIDSVESVGYYTATARYSGTAVRVLVAGPALSGTLVRIWVPDRHTSYTASLSDIADGGSYQLLDRALFQLRVTRP
jgi:hypothetical protein